MQNIKAKDVLAYATMPRVFPRVKDLFSSGFGYLSFLMAQVFSIVRLIPNGHPYLMSENIGRFGFRHVLAQAAKNLTFSVKNIDQIVVFVAMISGIVILIAQFFLLVYATLISPVLAATMFDTVYPQTDIAFNILDQVFGVPDIFCSITTPTDCTDFASTYVLPLPFHQALHGLFQFYSTGLMLIAVLIFLYFLVVVIVETAVTGTPFGQRFQNFWVPIRLIVAIGLLMPIDYGLGSGQYIVLYTAKYASGFATNGWNAFNSSVAAHSYFLGGIFPDGLPAGERYSYFVLPEAPDLSSVVEAMSLVHACAYAYHRLNSGVITGNINETRNDGTFYNDVTYNYAEQNANIGEYEVQAFLVKTRTAAMVDGALSAAPNMFSDVLYGDSSIRSYIDDTTVVPYYINANATNALGFYYGSDIIIRFGEMRMKNGNPNNYEYSKETGYVKPLCGDIRIPISDLTDIGGSGSGAIPVGTIRGGASQMQRFYYELILELWFNSSELRQIGRSIVEAYAEQNPMQRSWLCNTGETSTGETLMAIDGGSGPDGFMTLAECPTGEPGAEWRSVFIETENNNLKQEVRLAWENYVLNSYYAQFEAEIAERGWGGAGIWYNKLAEVNGGWMDGVDNVPYMERYPLVMEQVKEFKKKHVENTSSSEIYDPRISAESEGTGAEEVQIEEGEDALKQIAIPLAEVYNYWNKTVDQKDNNKLNQVSHKNPFLDAIHILLGTTGLVSIRGANQHMHPLAQLVAVGKGLVNSAVLNMAGATTGAFLGGMLKGMQQFDTLAGALEAASSMFYSVAFLGLTAGFVLFYVLPFLPFLYFFFAVANWVKAIFEAMLGVPLWALAHMRIDGEGLPGDAASNGYFLILEIFIRPILTVIALLSSIIIFATQVRILNMIWDMVTANTAGFTEIDDINGVDPSSYIYFFRDKLDQFFFTVIYTVVSYMLAMSSFKLIDKIPDNILRWGGASVSAYGDIDQDNVEGLSRYAAVGGMTIGNQAAGAVMQLGGGLGKTIGGQVGQAVNSKGK